MSGCIFCKIVHKEIPKEFIYEDEYIVAFLDHTPVHAGHVLVIPRCHVEDFTTTDPVDAQAITDLCQRVARALLVAGYDGVNVLTNIKPAGGQVVPHTHFHIIPRRANDGLPTWPQRPYAEGEEHVWVEKLRTMLI